MTQLTPEELAACREAYCKEYGYDPEWDVVIDEDFQKAFSAGLFHKQAESAKEIAALKAQIEKHSKTATPADYVVEQNKRLKAQVEGLRKDLISCRGSVKTDLNQTERMLLAKEKHNEQDTTTYTAASAEAQRLFGLLERIDAAIAQEKNNGK